jgi:hypothetical protein
MRSVRPAVQGAEAGSNGLAANQFGGSPPTDSDFDAAEVTNKVIIESMPISFLGSFKRISFRLAEVYTDLTLDPGATGTGAQFGPSN